MNEHSFHEANALDHLKHYLPHQNPLKDFIHHNSLHAFQHYPFQEGVLRASTVFGYKVYLGLDEYRKLYRERKIKPEQIEQIIEQKKGKENIKLWSHKLLNKVYDESLHQRVGYLYQQWNELFRINFVKEVHPILFRVTGNYLDQGIALWKIPNANKGFLSSLRELERHSYSSLFKTNYAKNLLLNTPCAIKDLLDLLIGDEKLYERYLFDQQFSHPGFSGMVANIESHPENLLDKRQIKLSDFIAFELLLEIDALKAKYEKQWPKMSALIKHEVPELFPEKVHSDLFEMYQLWQEAFEWSYYEEVLRGLQLSPKENVTNSKNSFQGIFCIDDREISLRTYLEHTDPNCATYSTAGFFNVEFYFQPEHGKFHTKVCPAPVTPKHLIVETEAKKRHKKDAHFSKQSKEFFSGWLISQTIGFWSGLRLALNIFKPIESPVMVSSFKHMDKNGKLKIERINDEKSKDNLLYGFSIEEMADRMEGLFKSIGLIENFASLVYIVGHGASSINNTHYAGYDCGACSGRAGSVNARVAAFMANHKEVRKILSSRGINVPEETFFIGALHDTTKDEIDFFDENQLNIALLEKHQQNKRTFQKALDLNAKERSRRFLYVKTNEKPEKVHDKVRLRAMSLFEPRPEWNHATNALCFVGRRSSCEHLFLDRRAFLNSYNYSIDPEGKYLLGILRAVAPVCGGINLEYYFSRVDTYRLGAGTKLPHNVIGLIGVANGIDGDLRPGLPKQMINIHDPLRLLVIVEHYPDVILKTIESHPPTYEWFTNEWVNLVCIHPETKALYRFNKNTFAEYHCLTQNIPVVNNLEQLTESSSDNLNVHVLSKTV